MSLQSKIEYTICDIIDALVQSEIESDNLQYFLEIIEEEWYICEERKGGTDPTASELFDLCNFIRNKLNPLRIYGHFNDVDDTPRKMIKRFIESNVSKKTCSHILLQANSRSIQESIQSIIQSAKVMI